MKNKQRNTSRKMVHMAIQPLIREHLRLGTQKLTSPQAMLQQNISQGKDAIYENNILQIEEDNSMGQSSLQQDNEPLSGNIEQKQHEVRQELTKSYMNDFYESVLKPISFQIIRHSVWFVLLFCLLRMFWIFKDIEERKGLQEEYMRKIMVEQTGRAKQQYQKMFAFLTQAKQFIQLPNSGEFQFNQIKKLQQYEGRYSFYGLRDIANASVDTKQLQSYIVQLIDLNYELVALQIGSLMAQAKICNVFLVDQLSYKGAFQYNLTQVQKNQKQNQAEADQFVIKQQGNPSSSMQSKNKLSGDHINVFSNYIYQQKLAPNNSQTTGVLSLEFNKNYQLYELEILSQQNSTLSQNNKSQSFKKEGKKFNLYCINTKKYVYQLLTFNMKLCVSIAKQYQNQIDNLLFVNNDFTKVQITNNKILSSYKQSNNNQKVYQKLQQFITSEIKEFYTEYELHEKDMKKCLQFYEEFHEQFEAGKERIQVLRCYCDSYMQILVSKYIFSWSRILPESTSYHNLQNVSISSNEQYLEFYHYYLSNRTYYSEIHQITRSGVDSIELTIKIYIIILCLSLFALQFSVKIVENIMIESLFYIKRLLKIILCFDQVKKTENQFKKVLKEIQENYQQPKTPILPAFIGYLQKFLWIKKLYHLNRKFPQHKIKKIRLLFEGLNLFKYLNNGQFPQSKQLNSKKQEKSIKSVHSNKLKSTRYETEENNEVTEKIIKSNYRQHPGALIYVYRELISLERQKIEKFNNIKMLTKRKTQKENQSQMNILHQIEDHKVSGYNKESRLNYKEQVRGVRYSKQMENQTIFGEQVPKISIMDSKPRQNRGVRFSNQIQFRGFNAENPEKKSKFRQQIHSNSSIGNRKGSLKSFKSIDSQLRKKGEQSQKQQRSQSSSGLIGSLKKMRRQATIKNILRGDESVHEGLRTLKFDQSSNIQEKSSIMNKSSVDDIQGEISIDQFYYTQKQALEETLQSYEKMIHYYEQVVEIEECSLQKELLANRISFEEQEERANLIYGIELKRLKVSHYYLQLLIEEHVDQQIEIDLEELGVTVSYEHLHYYEKNYDISIQLLQEAHLYKMKVDVALGKTINYKRLEEIINSDHPYIALQATLFYAKELHKLQPFLDYEVINTLYNSLLLYDTPASYKQHSLQLIINTLQSNRNNFAQQIDQLRSIKKYYNKKHKKFYFIADMTESFDIFTPILTKIYELMGKMDLMEIFNLAMNQNSQDMQIVRQIIKPQTLQAFLSLFQQLTLETSKSKEKNSSKIIHKKYVYEKDFNEILDEIQKDQTQFSTFIVVILGGDQISSHSSMITDDADSSSNQRQLNQLLHSQINRKISQNYYHFVNIGTYLNNFLTKQGILQLIEGKLKKHIKNSPDLLEIDLIKKNLAQNFSQLQKFLQ